LRCFAVYVFSYVLNSNDNNYYLNVRSLAVISGFQTQYEIIIKQLFA